MTVLKVTVTVMGKAIVMAVWDVVMVTVTVTVQLYRNIMVIVTDNVRVRAGVR